MSAEALLADLRARGVAVEAVDGRLRCRARPGTLTPSVLDRLRADREAVLAALADPAVPDRSPERSAAEEAARIAAAIEAMPDLVKCGTCGFERNREIATCPACNPESRLPTDCLARTVCTVLGPCERQTAGNPCLVGAPSSPEASEPELSGSSRPSRRRCGPC